MEKGAWARNRKERKMAQTVNHKEIVTKLLNSKAVDFTAIGKMVAELGPALAVAEEPWEGFCGTMRYFIHIYRVTPGTVFETPAEGIAVQG